MKNSARVIKSIVAVFILVIFIVLVFENYPALSNPLKLKANFLIVSWEIPDFSIAAYLLLSFLFGFLLAEFFNLMRWFRKELKKRNQPPQPPPVPEKQADDTKKL